METKRQQIVIKEQHLMGKRDLETCEDGIVATDDFVAVIDGSTSKARQQLSTEMRNGKFAMLLLKETITKLPQNVTKDQFCAIATDVIASVYEQHNISKNRLVEHPEERLTASICIFSLFRKEIWMIGDCQCLCNGRYYDNPKPHEAPVANRRSKLIHEMISGGIYTVKQLLAHDYARDAVVADIIESCHHQNIDFSVIDGFPVALDKVVTIHADTSSDIVLASDGYPFLFPTLNESEKALTQQLSNDPLCYQTFLATKGKIDGNVSFDDRAYIRFCVE